MSGLSMEFWGCSYLKSMFLFFSYRRVGWDQDDVWFAHCCMLDDAETKQWADDGVGIAHCPSSNMRLASGIAPVSSLYSTPNISYLPLYADQYLHQIQEVHCAVALGLCMVPVRAVPHGLSQCIKTVLALLRIFTPKAGGLGGRE